MRNYPPNSPEAMARIIVLCMLADSDLDPSELDDVHLQQIVDSTGLNHHQLMLVLKHYLEDIAADESGHERINLLQPERVNRLLDDVTGHGERLRTLATALSVCKADHALNPPELAVFRHIMQHWQMDITDLAAEVGQPLPPADKQV